MKSRILAILVFLVVGATCFAQASIQPLHRFAVRVNTLGVFNLDLIGDVEYCLSERIGVFVGGGSEYFQPTFNRPNAWFTKESEDFCKRTNWGVYAGMRISIPVWKLKGLSLRPYLFYQRVNMAGDCWGPPPSDGPGISSIRSSEMGIALNIAYTQVFAKRLFVEPVIGIGPEVLDRTIVPNGQGRYLRWVMPIQLNLGVKF